MINLTDVLKEIETLGFISLTNPSKMEQFKNSKEIVPFAEVEEARRLYRMGVPQKEIGAKLNRSPNTINDWINYKTRKNS